MLRLRVFLVAMLIAVGLLGGCARPAAEPPTPPAPPPSPIADADAGPVGLTLKYALWQETPYIETHYQPLDLASGLTVYPVEVVSEGATSYNLHIRKDGWVWKYGTWDGLGPMKVLDAPVPVAPIAMEVGDEWHTLQGSGKVLREQSVTVAGTVYDHALKVEWYNPDGTLQTYRYYVPDIGLVLGQDAEERPILELVEMKRQDPAPVLQGLK